MYYFKKRYYHTNCIFRDHRLLKFHDIIYLQTILFAHKSLFLFPLDAGFTAMPCNVT